MHPQILYGSVGAAYGACLIVLGWVIAGYGHGSYLPIGIAASPLSLFGIRVALFVPVILWTGIALFLLREDRGSRNIVFGIVALHYLGIVALFFVHPYKELEYLWISFEHAGVYVLFFILVYLFGQTTLWSLIVKAHDGKHK
jgi:hypothetical protein